MSDKSRWNADAAGATDDGGYDDAYPQPDGVAEPPRETHHYGSWDPYGAPDHLSEMPYGSHPAPSSPTEHSPLPPTWTPTADVPSPDPGGLPGAAPPTHTQAPPRSTRLLVLLVALGVLVTAAVAGVVWWRVTSGPDYPSAWDPRVKDLVDVVEKERHLAFEHPVYVDFMPEADFQKEVTADDADLSAEDREEMDNASGLLRSLGVVSGDFDLFESTNQLNGAGIIGYYSYEDERIRVRGTKITPAVRSTLVHELTHALQDQHFDLGGWFKDLEDDPDRASIFRAVVEGDARRIETDWRNSLDPAERKKLEKSVNDETKQFEDDSADVPEVLKSLMAAPYAFGEAMVTVGAQRAGDGAVDSLFVVPPTTDEQLVDPYTFYEDHQGVLEVAEPKVPKGAEKFDDGPFGAIGWLMVLSERIPPKQALAAVQGWGGDAYVAYEQDGVSCASIAYAGDEPADRVRMRAAITAWVRQMPKGAAHLEKHGSRLLLTSCDPGPDAAGKATGGSSEALSLAISRTYLTATLVKTGADTETARCAAGRLVSSLTVEELNDPHIDPARVRSIMQPCLPA